MNRFAFDKYEIELVNDPDYDVNSTDNVNAYEFVYVDEEDSPKYRMVQHGIKVYQNGQIYKSAIVCSSGGATGIYENSVILDKESALICCSKSLFKVSLPDLKLQWVRIMDMATCFSVYKVGDALFTHGEMQIARLNSNGEILWEYGFPDILVSIDSTEPNFAIHSNYIETIDFSGNRYKVDFNGKLLEHIPAS